MARRSKQIGALAGLRSVQTLGALAVPSTLENVPEEIETRSEITKPEIFKTDDWKSVENAVKDIFRDQFPLEDPGKIYGIQQNVKNILRSRTGTFLSDCYKEWLSKEMYTDGERLRHLEGLNLLRALEEAWTLFYKSSLPTLEGILHLLKPKGRASVRCTTLSAFRDIIFFSSDHVEEAVVEESDSLTPHIRQMILILQNINDTYPPSKNGLRLEDLAAQFCTPFMGYFGIYENGELVVTSNVPTSYSKRRPSADVRPRRISRPFSVQPQQMDTLNQMFKSTVC